MAATFASLYGMDDLRIDIELTHPAAAFAATLALEGMTDRPLFAEGTHVSVPVAERGGAVIEAARRLIRAGVGVHDIAVS